MSEMFFSSGKALPSLILPTPSIATLWSTCVAKLFTFALGQCSALRTLAVRRIAAHLALGASMTSIASQGLVLAHV